MPHTAGHTSRFSTPNAQTLFQAGSVVNSASSRTSGQQQSQSSQTTSQQQQFLSATGRQALDTVIAQLAAGGTPQQRAFQADILRTIQAVEVQRAQYGKDAAFRDAEGAVQLQLQRALESTLPTVLLASEAAGTSGDAVSALLTNDLTARAAGTAAEVGLNAAAQYGRIAPASTTKFLYEIAALPSAPETGW